MLRREVVFYILISTIVFTYLAIRSWLNPVVNDEAYTFLHFVHAGSWWPFSQYAELSANNHVLNSLLIEASTKLFGISAWSLRLPNLLAFPVFIWYVYHLGLFVSNTALRWLFWLSLLLTSGFIEYFSYARGYGISLALLAGSIYFLLQSIRGKTHLYLVLSFLFISLAVFANLNLLLTFLTWLGAVNFLMISQKKWRALALYNLLAVWPLLFGIKYSLALEDAGELYLGADNFHASLFSIYSRYTYGSPIGTYILMAFIGFIAGGGLLYLIKRKKIGDFSIFFIFFILSISSAIILNFLFGTPYPTQRTSLHWYFFFSGTLVFFADAVTRSFKTWAVTAVAIIFFPVFLFSLQHLSLFQSTSPYWVSEQVPPHFYREILEQKQAASDPISLGCGINYFTYVSAFQNMAQNANIGYCQVIKKPKSPKWMDLLIVDTTHFRSPPGFETLLYDKASGLSLLKNTIILEEKQLGDTSFSQTNYNQDAWIPLMEHKQHQLDSAGAYQLNFLLKPESDEVFYSLLTVQIRDSTGKMEFYDQLRFDFYWKDAHPVEPIPIQVTIDAVMNPSGTLQAFFWNPHNQSFKLDTVYVALIKKSLPGSGAYSEISAENITEKNN